MKANFLVRFNPIIIALFLFSSSHLNAQVQIVYPPNSSFNYAGTITEVPNHIAPPSWWRQTPGTTPDINKTGTTNYGFTLWPEYNSTDGESWLRCIDIPSANWVEGVYTTVTGLVPGRDYYIKF